MSDRPKFYLDEHIYDAVREQLLDRNIEVMSTNEAGRKGKSDESNMAWAIEGGWVIVTFDSDYVAMHYAGLPHAGIAYFTEQAGIGRIVSSLALLHGVFSAVEMIGRLEYL